MTSSLSVRLDWEALRTYDSANLAGNYVAMGGPLLHNAFLIKMYNGSTVDVSISIDKATDIDICPASSYFLYDECSNASREGGLTIPKHTQFYIKGPKGAGKIYFVVQYARY